MQEEDIGAPTQPTPPNPVVRPPALDLDDFVAPQTQRRAVIADESSISFIGDRETTHAIPPQQTGAVVSIDRDPIPAGPVGWLMKFTKIKRVKTARIVGSIFIGLLIVLAVIIVAREYFISFVTIPIPKTTNLVKELPVIE